MCMTLECSTIQPPRALYASLDISYATWTCSDNALVGSTLRHEKGSCMKQ